MTIDRKDFLKKVCFSGACLGGFSSIAFPKESNDAKVAALQAEDKNLPLLQEWITSILQNVPIELDKESARKLIRKTAEVHYNNLKMDSQLAEYEGNIDKFIAFLQNNWGWKVDYDKEKKILIADENKNYCVCPIAVYNKEKDSSAMCYCSEGFAEKMFSKVSGVQAKAEVIASIRKGDSSCKYKIAFS
jgi:hypothetical protein